MKKKLLFLSLGLTTFGANVFGQQDMALTHFIFNKMNFNPGATAIDEGICGTLIYRNQWDKVNGAPNSFILNVEGDITRWLPIKAGITAYHDEIGFTRQSNAALNVAYPLTLSPGTLQIGVGLGMQNIGMDPTWVPPSTINDPSLPTAFGSTQFDMNFGIYFKGLAGYYAGISSTHLTAPSFEADGSQVAGSPNPIYDAARHYYIMGGYKYGLSSGDDIDGNVLVETDMIKTSASINARYLWQNKAYGGLTYRTSDEVGVMLGADIMKMMNNWTKAAPRFIIGYSYDFTINKLSSISTGSHEIMLKYCYYLPPIPIQTAKHPRWL